MPFSKVRFAYVGSFAVSQVLRKTSTAFPSSVKLLQLHLKQKRPLGRALDKDEGESFDMVAGEMLCVQIGVYARVRQGEEK